MQNKTKMLSMFGHCIGLNWTFANCTLKMTPECSVRTTIQNQITQDCPISDSYVQIIVMVIFMIRLRFKHHSFDSE